MLICDLCIIMSTMNTFSETTPDGRRITKLDQILLNGNNITMLVPGGEYPLMFYRVCSCADNIGMYMYILCSMHY